jgi:GNAT superfamily N-acetyltransferase
VATIIPNLTRAARPYALIENVVTHAAYRRRGLGRSVMQAALDRCWSAGCYKVMLLSEMQRREVHRFYEELGFDRSSKQGFLIRPPEKE